MSLSTDYHISPPADERSWDEKAGHFVRSFSSELAYLARTGILCTQERLFDAPAEYEVLAAREWQWKANSGGLYVLIHGLHGRPNAWDPQLSLLKAEQPDHDVCVPRVPHRGDCPISDSVAPILGMIEDYIENHPSRPICLLGVSNGGRIAMEMALRLRDRPTSIKVSIVAGAVMGTMRINVLRLLSLDRYFCSKVVAEDLTYDSADARARIDRARQPLPDGVERDYEFYSSTEDSQIRPYNAALPILNQGEQHYTVYGSNHGGIVSEVCREQITRCMEWMNSEKQV
jgi:pimeloyl-ACP methyl ester carboxylesterase